MSIREPLAGVIFLLAQEQADEMAGVNDAGADGFAALFRDGPDLARRARELVETDEVDVGPEAIEPEQWEVLETSAGVVVRRHPDAGVTVALHPTDAELAAVLNWTLQEFSRAELPEDFRPYDGQEVAGYRAGRLIDVIPVRARLLDEMRTRNIIVGY